MKNNKRAFTIVELVIVIAVIGILAAVLIPTFSSLIQKANMNSDEAAVKSMNTYLSADEQINGKPASWQDAVKVLSKSNLDAENYRALSSEHQLVWDASINRVLYVEKTTQAVVYPEEYTADGMLDLGYEYGNWTTLEGKMVADDSWRYNVSTNLGDYKVEVSGDKVVYTDGTGTKLEGAALESFISSKQESGEYVDYFGGNQAANLAAMEYKNNAEIKSGMAEFKVGTETYTIAKVNKGEQLVSYTEFVQQDGKNDGANFTLVLTDDIDLNGTQWKPIGTYAGNIDGGVKNAEGEIEVSTIKNFTMSDRTAEVAMYSASTEGGSYYYYGFISVFTGNYLGNLVFEGQQVENPGVGVDAPAGFKKTGHAVGVLAGLVDNDDDEDVLIENITVGAGTLTGMSRVGGVVCMVGSTATGDMTGGSVTFKNVVNNANVVSEGKVNQAHSTAGGIVSCLYAIDAGNVAFIDCVNNGNVTGGIAGGMFSTSYSTTTELTFVGCVNNGQINGVQYNKWYEKPTIYEDTFKYGAKASGFIGDLQGDKKVVKFTDCESNGLVTLTNANVTPNAEAQCPSLDYVVSAFAKGSALEFAGATVAKNEFKVELTYGTAVEAKYE